MLTGLATDIADGPAASTATSSTSPSNFFPYSRFRRRYCHQQGAGFVHATRLVRRPAINPDPNAGSPSGPFDQRVGRRGGLSGTFQAQLIRKN